MARALSIFTLAMALGACGDDGPVGNVDGELTDAAADADAVDSRDAVDSHDAAVEVDILYPGYLCEEDHACSTGLCYGAATAQGFFEPAQCQAHCLEPFDYLHYCDSDDDCCRGHCCLDCGAKTGLCTLP
ncbi:MAG: hypothetical protein U1F43_30605 [Myxococcota bacterium]